MPTFRALPNVAQHYEMLATALEYCLVPLDMSNSVTFLPAFHIFNERHLLSEGALPFCT
jgi:hypothetical protein